MFFLILQSLSLEKPTLQITWNLKGLRKRQTFWDLSCSSRSLGILLFANENQNVIHSAFSPEIYLSLEASCTICFKWFVLLLTFRQVRSSRCNREGLACFTHCRHYISYYTCERYICCRMQITKKNLGKYFKPLLNICYGTFWKHLNLRMRIELRKLLQISVRTSNIGTWVLPVTNLFIEAA